MPLEHAEAGSRAGMEVFELISVLVTAMSLVSAILWAVVGCEDDAVTDGSRGGSCASSIYSIIFSSRASRSSSEICGRL